MVTDGNQTYRGDHFMVYKIISSLCCTPETNVILYIKCNSIKKGLSSPATPFFYL